jgi:hypothetical protein
MRVTCPNDPEHKEFITTAHEMHDWVVDSEGNFLRDLGCVQIDCAPDKDNIWSCNICGVDAIVEND